MKIKGLVKIQSLVEGTTVPSDIPQILNLLYYSKSKKQLIQLGEMHLTHFIRVFANMLESNDSPLQNEIDKMRERLDEIEEESKHEHKH